MEWRPSFSALVQSRVSLLQIAHFQAVYLIDMLALTSQDEGAIVVVPSGATGHPASEIQDAVTSDCKVPHDCPAENMESGKDKASTASRLLTFLQRIFSSTDVLKLGTLSRCKSSLYCYLQDSFYFSGQTLTQWLVHTISQS